ncbi:MAG: PqqD family protein [Anaerolineae bacterium]
MLTLDDVLEPAPGVVSRESNEELVVVLPREGKFLVLNGTGAEVFRMLDGERSLEDITVALHDQYEAVPFKQIRKDVLAFAKKILGRDAAQLVKRSE